MYVNPYEFAFCDGKREIKANFHTHAGQVDACSVNTLEDVFSLYRNAGYLALGLTNHDRVIDVKSMSDKYEMCIYNGYEYTTVQHMSIINVDKTEMSSHQMAIDAANKSGGFAIICHPHFVQYDYWPLEMLDGLNGFMGLEILNPLIFRLTGNGYAGDVTDYLLSKRRLVRLFGNDDLHLLSDGARVANVIFSNTDRADILKAVSEGEFYISTGLTLKQFTLTGSRIEVQAGLQSDTRPQKFIYDFIGEHGNLLSRCYGKSAIYELDDELYVRVEVRSDHGAMLFTQPVYKKEEFVKP